jgi:hypothetical protein
VARLLIRSVCALFWCFATAAQTQNFIDPWADLTRSLRDAPLSETERADIYRVVDDRIAHDSFAESERAKERETVLSSLVGDGRMAGSGPAQVLVRSPQLFCGVANCTLWLFVRESGHLRLILETIGTGLGVRSAVSKGFHDLSSGVHMSAFEQDYTIYRWNGRKYVPTDSYVCRFDREDPEKPLPGVDARCRQ